QSHDDHRADGGATPDRGEPAHALDASAAVGVEAVAHPAHRLDGMTAEWRVDLAPQVTDIHLDDVRIAVAREVPDLVEHLSLGQRLAGPPHKQFEQGELPRSKRD